MHKHRTKGLRYVELKESLNVSDSTLTNRLDKLRDHQLVELKAHASESGRNYITYQLTEIGREGVKRLNVPDLLERVDDLTLA
ncbi:MAG: transcriptional regulator [Thaumarchaeota archaeon]|nr:transcriptional regulator [Nitrososphaerota archaeon]